MSEVTEGEWEALGTMVVTPPRAEFHRRIWSEAMPFDNKRVARFDRGEYIPLEEARANARLCAAAKELLAYAECMTALNDWLDGRVDKADADAIIAGHGGPDDETRCRWINEFGRKALAKAKGGAL